MKNTMFSGNLEATVKELEASFEKVLEAVGKPKESLIEESSLLGRVHSLYVLKAIGELKESICILGALLELSEEDFANSVTAEGKKTLKEVEMEIMMSMMADMMHKMAEDEG